MDKIPFNDKEKYYPMLMKNQIKYENNKKNKYIDLKSANQNKDKMLYFLSDKKERNSFTFFKTLDNADYLSNDMLNKKFIKVNIDNKSKSKTNIYNASYMINSAKRTPKMNSKFLIKEEDISMNQKINNFESRIDNLLNVISDFETKFINSPETQKIKEQFSNIMNKNIYKDKINENDYLLKSSNKKEINDNNKFEIKEKSKIDINKINNINNINININNNNYENNYFITHSMNEDIGHKTLNQKQNKKGKKISISSNNSIIKKTKLKTKKKMSKCNSNDLKNKILLNYKEKSKMFNLPLDSSTYNNYTIKNNRYKYNNSYKDLQIPFTDRKLIDGYKINEFNNLRNSLKNINIKKNNCLKINKAASSKNEIRRKTFIKKDRINKVYLFKTKKKLMEKNLTPSSVQGNPLINNTINGGIDIIYKNREKEKSVNGSAEFIKMKRKENSEFINYILNKRNIIKGNIAIGGNNQYEFINNKDFLNIKKSFYNKKK